MPRFVLYTGPSDRSAGDLSRIRDTPGLLIVEQEGTGLLLVEGDEDVIRGLMAELPGWHLAHESTWRLLHDAE